MRMIDMILFLPLAFVIGFAFGVLGPPRDGPTDNERARVEGHARRTWTNREHMTEQRAVVSQWRIWTERAAASGECIGHVLPGREPQ